MRELAVKWNTAPAAWFLSRRRFCGVRMTTALDKKSRAFERHERALSRRACRAFL